MRLLTRHDAFALAVTLAAAVAVVGVLCGVAHSGKALLAVWTVAIGRYFVGAVSALR